MAASLHPSLAQTIAFVGPRPTFLIDQGHSPIYQGHSPIYQGHSPIDQGYSPIDQGLLPD